MNISIPKSNNIITKDSTMLLITAILAGCGMLYEFLLSHYAARVLGSVETVIFTVFVIMIVSMGVGSLMTAKVKDPFTTFAWLEVFIGIVGGTSVIVISALIAYSIYLPQVLAANFGVPHDMLDYGGIIQNVRMAAEKFPYFTALIIGLCIGLEIPLVVKIREILAQEKLENNVGMVYGVDYIGAGIAGFLWINILLYIEPTLAASIVGGINLITGVLFLYMFWKRIHFKVILVILHIISALIVLSIGFFGETWEDEMEDMLYVDKVVYSMDSKYQHIVVTERVMNPDKPPVVSLYINGHTQFSSNDEKIYHSYLVYPAMLASAKTDNILVIGGGDGLAVRDLLRWNPKNIDLIDLDEEIVTFFKEPKIKNGKIINKQLLDFNNYSFSDERVSFHFGDAFLKLDDMLSDEKIYDVIIIDLPDPSHPNLNKLYSSRFYSKVMNLLSNDGALVVQSTSPYHAKSAFLSIGKTVKHAGFKHVDQYHANVPAFGEWGWTIATKKGASARSRIKSIDKLPIDDGFMTIGLLNAGFEFPKGYFDNVNNIEINRLGSGVLYDYHRMNWEVERGIYQGD